MKAKLMNESERDSLLVKSFKQFAKKGNQNGVVRVNELRRIGASVESEHGIIRKFEEMCKLVDNSLKAVKTRNSFGYVEVSELLEDVIREIRYG